MPGKRGIEPPWVRWYVGKMETLVCEPWMTFTCWRVLVCLLPGLRTNGSTTVTQQNIQEKTGIAQPHISEALAVLREHGVVQQIRRGRYYLATAYVYRGDRTQLPYVRQQERGRRQQARERSNGQTSATRRQPGGHGALGTDVLRVSDR